MHRGRPLVAILTKVDLVPSITRLLTAVGIQTTAVFVKASVGACQRRTLYRNLPAADIASRLKAIEEEAQQIEARTSFASEYFFIDNGDDRPFASAVQALFGVIMGRSPS
jgi:hypothetical protein